MLIVLAIFLPSALQSIPHPEYYRQFRDAGFFLILGVSGATVIAVLISRFGEAIAQWMENRFSHAPASLGHRLAQKVRDFGLGLNTIQGPWSLLTLAVLSLGIWYVTALAYQEVTHSYGVEALEIPVSQLLILMGASMLGSMLQLPAVGGGSQMATIAALSSVFDVPPELAASCGICSGWSHLRRSCRWAWHWHITRDCHYGSCRRKVIGRKKRRSAGPRRDSAFLSIT